MPRKLTNAQIDVVLAKTVGDLTPSEVDDLVDALSRTSHVKANDRDRSAESTLTTIFTGTWET